MKHLDIVKGVCPNIVNYEIEDGRIYNLKFDKGCQGNTTFITKLVNGREVSEVIELAEGIQCGAKGTSCADQLAQSLKRNVK